MTAATRLRAGNTAYNRGDLDAAAQHARAALGDPRRTFSEEVQAANLLAGVDARRARLR